jgi:hypothetical protein
VRTGGRSSGEASRSRREGRWLLSIDGGWHCRPGGSKGRTVGATSGDFGLAQSAAFDELVAGDDRQPGEVGLNRPVGRIDAHRQVDRALMAARAMTSLRTGVLDMTETAWRRGSRRVMDLESAMPGGDGMSRFVKDYRHEAGADAPISDGPRTAARATARIRNHVGDRLANCKQAPLTKLATICDWVISPSPRRR